MSLNGCIPLRMYCREFDETKLAVHKRISKGIWAQGKEYHKVKGHSQLWIDLDAVTQWVRQNSES